MDKDFEKRLRDVINKSQELTRQSERLSVQTEKLSTQTKALMEQFAKRKKDEAEYWRKKFRSK